ncbi:MAG: RHS repeat protein [Oscillospiraceae bacterium]|nr:RHS repeat protein [Oscillospiraceae bacterium]
MKKRALVLLLASLLLLCACSQKEVSHEGHFVSDFWNCDAKEHWHLCECDEAVQHEAHKLDDMRCTVCGAEIWEYDDGMTDLYRYDDYGNLTRSVSYDADGNVIYDQEQRYQYTEDGDLRKITTYENGMLSGETEYAQGDDGAWYEALYTGYYEDGSYFTNQYDESGSILVAEHYDEDHVLQQQTYFTYAAGMDGEPYAQHIRGVYADGTSAESTYNTYGDVLAEVSYAADGSTVSELYYEYTYDDQGRTLTETRTENGRLKQELHYAIVEEEDGWFGYPETTTEYFEDGTKHVIFCDIDGNETVTRYDKDGNVIE